MKKNRLFKSRISNFIAYEWIMLIVVAVVGIVLWEIVYSIASVKPTVGQYFKYYYDYGVYGSGSNSVHKELVKNDAWSFDVLKCDYENILKDTDVLSTRLSIGEGDAIFTETSPQIAPDAFDPEKDKYNPNRANSLIDNQLYNDYDFYDYDRLVKESKEYLGSLLKDELLDGEGQPLNVDDALDFDNLDAEKITAGFNKRLGKDNRFRTKKQKLDGIELENARIKKLCEDTAYLTRVLAYDDTLSEGESLFYRYTAGEQSLALAESEKSKKDWQYLVDLETKEGRANARYGLKLDRLTTTDEADRQVDKYIQLKNGTKEEPTKYLVLLIYDFSDDQSVLQFETVTFTAEFIRMFSNQVD